MNSPKNRPRSRYIRVPKIETEKEPSKYLRKKPLSTVEAYGYAQGEDINLALGVIRENPVEPKDMEEVIWMKCRASDICNGTRAKRERVIRLGNGSTLNRFTCTNCNGTFSIAL